MTRETWWALGIAGGLVVVWLAVALGIVVHVARAQGRRGTAWFFLAVVCSPPLALLALAALPDLHQRRVLRRLSRRLREPAAPDPERAALVDRLLGGP
jgi:hypothetical protein